MCESVPDWAAQRDDVEVEAIFPAGRVVGRRPNTIESALPGGWNHPDWQFHGTYLARVPDAQLVGDLGLVVLPDGSFAAEAIFSESHLRAAEPYRLWSPTRAVRRRRGNYFSLLTEYALHGNYYHWLHDVVMRLRGVLERLPADTQFIVPPGLRPFQYDTLAMLGIDRARLLAFDGREPWLLEFLYFAPGTPRSPATYEWLRDVALEANDVSLGPPTRRIYVTRRHASRRVVNEPEVEAMLHEHGFETHELETASFAEQVALFAKADVVVTPHGSGTTNILFSPTGLKVVEFFEPGYLSGSASRVWLWMSTVLHHEYWCLVGDTGPERDGWRDVVVPLDKLAKTLDHVLLARDDPASD